MTQAQDSLGRPFTTEGNSPESQTAVFTTEAATHFIFFSMYSQTETRTIISTTEELSDLHKENNFTDTETGPVNPSKSVVATIVIIVILLVLVGAGFLLYFFLCVHRKSHGTPTQVISVTPLYENISPAQNVVPNSSSAPDQVYESLQHGDQNVYNELMFRQNPSEVPSVGSSP
ncbi:uncharacterized protein LOC144328497 isoform X2 [Podarcis muralis]